jgi:serpin B
VGAVLAAALAVTGACGGGDDEPAAGAGVELVTADVARVAPPPSSPVDEVVAGIDAFGLRAERMLAAEGGDNANTVLSPTSIAVAFAMVSAAADDATAARIAEVFGFPGAPGVHEAMNGLTATLASANETDPDRGDVVLDVANSLWSQSGFEIGQEFLDTLAAQYGAGLSTTDFESDPDGARRAINASVAESTRDRITDLMPEGSVIDDTRSVVVNAIYLKAAWETEFSEEATAPQAFHLADGTTVDVPMMHASLPGVRGAVTEDYTAAELPYLGESLAMLVVVPNGPASLDDVLAGLGAGGLGAVADGLGEVAVDVTLPRWDTGTAADLGAILTELGLRIPGGSLPGIAPDLEITAAVHAADITVDEAGTEAAAATAAVIGVTSAPVASEIVTLVADRPYLFAVRHVETGAPLFVGRVADPRG